MLVSYLIKIIKLIPVYKLMLQELGAIVPVREKQTIIKTAISKVTP